MAEDNGGEDEFFADYGDEGVDILDEEEKEPLPSPDQPAVDHTKNDLPKPLTDNIQSKDGNDSKKRFKTFAEEGQTPNPKVTEAIAKCQEIIDAGQPWTDPEFPPTAESLVKYGEKPLKRDYEWQRASEIYPQRLCVFNDHINPDDIHQGELGNCYFLAVLSACAEVPRRIRNRVKINEINAAGIYCVTFFVNGVETPVIVDDYLPVVYGKPAFASTADGAIWPMLFEKAWAKLHGSYQRTKGGQTAHAAQHIIGLPAHSFHHENEQEDLKCGREKFWKYLVNFDKKDFLIMGGSNQG